MSNATSFQSVTEILNGIQASFLRVEDLLNTQPDEVINFKPAPEVWSIAENVAHLILSSRGVASSLARPKAFFTQFGVPKPSGTYADLKQRYEHATTKGLIAPPNVSPDLEHPSSIDQLKASWQMIKTKFSERLPTWTEEELEQYGLPHPLLGLITVREILFFNIFHNDHHYKIMQNRIIQAK